MKKQSVSLYCDNEETVAACKQYAEEIHRQFLIPIVQNIETEQKCLKINFLPSAEIEDTDIFDNLVQGFRDGWQRAIATRSA